MKERTAFQHRTDRRRYYGPKKARKELKDHASKEVTIGRKTAG
jgi:hypothetical protein